MASQNTEHAGQHSLVWDIIGNQPAVRALQQSLTQSRHAHAYLFVGPRSVGKTELALAFAQALNCAEPNPPCGTCSQCRRIKRRLHPDITAIALEEGQREISIDKVRELQHSLHLQPFEGVYRVTVIQDANRLSNEAANALLKTLEEPPEKAVLVLTSAEEEALLTTIRSRCRRVALYPVPRPVIEQALVEQHGVPPDQAEQLAVYARGLPGKALAALDNPGLIGALEGSLGTLRTLLGADTPGRLELSQTIAPAGTAGREELLLTMTYWLDWWRDLLLVETQCEAGLNYPQELDHYRAAAQQIDLQQCRRAIAAARDASRQIEQNANPRLVMDVLALNLPRYRQATIAE